MVLGRSLNSMRRTSLYADTRSRKKRKMAAAVAASGAWLAREPAAAQTLVNLVVRAVALIKADPDRAAIPIEAALGKGLIDRATIRASLTSPASTFVADPSAIIEATRAMQAYQVKLGSLDKEYPLDGLFDPSFYRKALAG